MRVGEVVGTGCANGPVFVDVNPQVRHRCHMLEHGVCDAEPKHRLELDPTRSEHTPLLDDSDNVREGRLFLSLSLCRCVGNRAFFGGLLCPGD